MQLYIAGHNQEEAKKAATILFEAGHSITSRWLYNDFKPTEEYSLSERKDIACMDASDVIASDAVVLLSSPEKVSGGKFVEVGIAIGLGKKVFIVGRRENMLMYHYLCKRFDSIETLVESLMYGD